MSKSKPPANDETHAPSMDDVLKRMLSSPPKQHKDQRVNPKPAEKQPAKRS